jgi:hypothetical protein
MAKKRKRHREPTLVHRCAGGASADVAHGWAGIGRLGPASNLRPAGAHDDKKLYDRKKIKAVLRRETEDGFDNSAP